jgi:hypothetical protein
MENHQKTKAATNTPPPPLRTDEGEWAKSDTRKADVLAEHFANVFKPYNSEISEEEKQEILNAFETPGQLETPIRKFKQTEVRSAINKLYPEKPQDMTLSQEKS